VAARHARPPIQTGGGAEVHRVERDRERRQRRLRGVALGGHEAQRDRAQRRDRELRRRGLVGIRPARPLPERDRGDGAQEPAAKAEEVPEPG